MQNLIIKEGFKYTESDIRSGKDIYSVKYEDLNEFSKIKVGDKVVFKHLKGYNEVFELYVEPEYDYDGEL